MSVRTANIDACALISCLLLVQTFSDAEEGGNEERVLKPFLVRRLGNVESALFHGFLSVRIFIIVAP